MRIFYNNRRKDKWLNLKGLTRKNYLVAELLRRTLHSGQSLSSLLKLFEDTYGDTDEICPALEGSPDFLAEPLLGFLSIFLTGDD